MNLFSMDSPLMRFLNLVANLFILHCLWVLYSLPLFTAGASTTALYYSCMRLIRNGDGYLSKNFRHSFRENFRQSTLIWMFLVVIGFLFFTDIRYCLYLDNTVGRIMLVGCSFFLIPFLLVAMYIFPVQATFKNRIYDNMKNAMLMSLRHLPLSFILAAIMGTLLFLGVFFRPFMGLMVICGAGLWGYLTSNIFVAAFQKYLGD